MEGTTWSGGLQVAQTRLLRSRHDPAADAPAPDPSSAGSRFSVVVGSCETCFTRFSMASSMNRHRNQIDLKML